MRLGQSDLHEDRRKKGTAIPGSLRNTFIRLCVSQSPFLPGWVGGFFVCFVWLGFFGSGWGFLTFGILEPWMFGNSRSLTAWSECHSVFVKTSHKSHMQGVSYFMEEVGFLIMLCMCTVNPVWLNYVRLVVYM